ncbi:ABC transporter permease [Bacillus sp. FJAT-29937]|uniref:ABC transporter permease n=1 Tax=Bacillus sp. FJAT-29937 TaxID=1720553 RepID=UPI0008352E0B|nr:ABC transporter permease [Bacillus sp. FJAT-29937]
MDNFRLIFEMTKKDFQKKYLGSYLGILWAFVNPIVTITVFWFVFQVGFKATPVDNFPFILWLVCGMVPWFFISETISTGTNSIIENDYLVKKVVFKVYLLPIIKILSGWVIHLFFIFFTFAIFIYYNISLDIYSFQLTYYGFSLIVLLIGITLLSSSLIIYLKDIGQLINLLLQFGFWLTPIFWSLKQIPDKYHLYLKLNPFYYVINGYRDSLIYKKWFWEYPNLTIYYWIVTLAILLIGIFLFKRLRPHFADSL